MLLKHKLQVSVEDALVIVVHKQVRLPGIIRIIMISLLAICGNLYIELLCGLDIKFIILRR